MKQDASETLKNPTAASSSLPSQRPPSVIHPLVYVPPPNHPHNNAAFGNPTTIPFTMWAQQAQPATGGQLIPPPPAAAIPIAHLPPPPSANASAGNKGKKAKASGTPANSPESAISEKKEDAPEESLHATADDSAADETESEDVEKAVVSEADATTSREEEGGNGTSSESPARRTTRRRAASLAASKPHQGLVKREDSESVKKDSGKNKKDELGSAKKSKGASLANSPSKKPDGASPSPKSKTKAAKAIKVSVESIPSKQATAGDSVMVTETLLVSQASPRLRSPSPQPHGMVKLVLPKEQVDKQTGSDEIEKSPTKLEENVGSTQ